MEGVSQTLEVLHGKVPMGIVTTSRKVNFDQIMASTGLAKYFDSFTISKNLIQREFPVRKGGGELAPEFSWGKI